jgi:hypothetical protein
VDAVVYHVMNSCERHIFYQTIELPNTKMSICFPCLGPAGVGTDRLR